MDKNIHILCADDEENDHFLLTLAVQKAAIPATLHFVKDGQFAIDYLSGAGQYADRQMYPLPQLAFFDIKMPRRTGLEALAWARQQPQFEHLPVLILSSSSHERDIKAAKDFRASAYVVKPRSVDLLSAEIKRFFVFWAPKANP